MNFQAPASAVDIATDGVCTAINWLTLGQERPRSRL